VERSPQHQAASQAPQPESRPQPQPKTPASWLANPRETKALLARYGHGPKHRLGQNFLVDVHVVDKILDLAELQPHDLVLEVGPGIGTLSVALLGRAGAVVALEADASLKPVLAETCAQDSERFHLHLGDALKVSPEVLVEALGKMPNKLVSNLPYQIAATLILKVLETMPEIERMVIMVQAEVADRIAAAPGSKAYGAYTAKLALFGQVTGRFEVGPGSFMPPPHVNSAVVRIDRWPEAASSRQETRDQEGQGELLPQDLATDEKLSCAYVIDAAFSQRRKTIRNAMASQGFDKQLLDTAFAAAKINPGCRAETLGIQDFIRLAQALLWPRQGV
jgi:16S rRNA (adenine1518-N6/adenine1519-N6)-dimethyltransferase